MIKSRCCDAELVGWRCAKCGDWVGRSIYFTYDDESPEALARDKKRMEELMERIPQDELKVLWENWKKEREIE